MEWKDVKEQEGRNRNGKMRVHRSLEKCKTGDQEILWKSETWNGTAESITDGLWAISRKARPSTSTSSLKILYTTCSWLLGRGTSISRASVPHVFRLHHSNGVCWDNIWSSSITTQSLAGHHHLPNSCRPWIHLPILYLRDVARNRPTYITCRSSSSLWDGGTPQYDLSTRPYGQDTNHNYRRLFLATHTTIQWLLKHTLLPLSNKLGNAKIPPHPSFSLSPPNLGQALLTFTTEKSNT